MIVRGIVAAQSALFAESRRLQASAHNRANALTEGFRALQVTNQEAAQPGAGVETRVAESELRGSPILDDSGATLGEHSNVSFVDEAVTRITAQRAYEANLKTIQAHLDSTDTLLDILG